MHSGHEYSSDRALIDVLMNLLMFSWLLLIIMIVISVITNTKMTEGVPVKAEYVISAKWQDGLDCDVDLWVQDPTGRITWFRNLNAGGIANLERDDRGDMGDWVEMDGKMYKVLENEEKFTIRKSVPGEYVVNAHLYACRNKVAAQPGAVPSDVTVQPGGDADVVVNVVLEKINPHLEVKRRAMLHFTKVWDEQTAFRFTIDGAGDAVSFDDTPKSLVNSKKD